jgi:hypothetical protein
MLFIVSDLLWLLATLVLCSLEHSLTVALLARQSRLVTSHAMQRLMIDRKHLWRELKLKTNRVN